MTIKEYLMIFCDFSEKNADELVRSYHDLIPQADAKVDTKQESKREETRQDRPPLL